jgi:hypothetical protein
MTAPHRPDDLADLRAELTVQRAEIAAQRAAIGALKRRRHLSRRALPLLVAVALVALIPLATLAAAPVFSDLGDAAEVHRPNIVAIGNAGITTGFDDPASGNPAIRLYVPKDLVTREEMASFLARTAGLGANPPVANAATALTVPDGAVTPAKLGKGGATVGQVLTATADGVAFQTPFSGVQNAVVRQATLTVPVSPPGPTPTPTLGSVSCAAGERATGGGFGSTAGSFLFPLESRPTFDPLTNSPTGWTAGAISATGIGGQGVVYAVCVPTP